MAVAVVVGAAIGLWRAAPGRDDRHARAHRDAAQLRRPGRGAGRLERLPRRSRPTPTSRPRSRATCSASTPPRWSSASSSARSPSPARSWRSSSCRPGSSRNPLMLPGHNLLNLGALVAFAVLTVAVRDRAEPRAAGGRHRARARAGLAPGRLDRRRRHAGRRLDAQQLLRLGRRRVGLPARQRPADHHRRAGRLLRCLPLLHHVQGDEPLVHLRHRRRLRQRGRRRRRRRLRRAPRDHRRGRRRPAQGRPLGRHHARLRHGRRAGAVRRRRAHPPAARARASTSGSASTRSPAGCPGT